MAIANKYPTLRPTLLLDFANSQTVDPRITFTRASTATRTNAKGLIETAAAGVPRIDYDPVTLACKGLLIEEQRTNLLTYSEDFGNAAWAKLNTTVSANVVTAPDGTLTADKLIEDNSSAIHYVYQGFSTLPNTTYALSVFVKAAGRTSVNVSVGGVNWLSHTSGIVNLTTGAAASGLTVASSAGDGWYRISITGTTDGTTASRGILISTALNASTLFAGDGTSGLFIWGAQLEVGAFPTSYIPTTTSAATRAADVASMTGANFSSWHRQDEGTFVVGFDAPNIPVDSSTFNRVYSVNDGTANNELRLLINGDFSPDRITAISVAGGVTRYDVGNTPGGYITTPVASAINAFAYKFDSCASAWNGGTTVQGSPAPVPTVDRLQIGGFNGAGQPNGHISRLAYYPTRLPNAQLQALTA